MNEKAKTNTVRPLDASTWDAFTGLVERNGGIVGGCRCMSGHPEATQEGIDRRAAKEERVRTGRAHATLVCRFLFSASVELFGQYGFKRVRQVGKHAWIVNRVLESIFS